MTLQEVISRLKFKDDQHKERYENLRTCYIGAGDYPEKYPDPYREALAYLIASSEDTYNHRHQLYNEEERCIIPEAVKEEWQTGSSLKITRLAFNLFTASINWCEDGEEMYCTPDYIFDSSDAPYFVEAVRLRMYSAFDE